MKILCLDSGSSSIKYSLFEADARDERGLVRGTLPGGASLGAVSAALEASGEGAPQAVGHRVVFGGCDLVRPAIVDTHVLEALERLRPVDALHLDPQLAMLREAQRRWGDVPNVACFDTAFFAGMPALAKRIPLPAETGVLLQRYGYHGLSYEYIVSVLGDRVRGRAIVAHLGSGASMAALRDGSPIDTTMGMTPLGGFMMSSRPGDLDPGVLLFLLDGGYTRAALTEMLYKHSGLLAVSESSGDMRVLEDLAARDERAAFAIDLFVYQIRKHAGALAAALGGLDLLVFTGGIGENSALVRDRVTDGLRHLGAFDVLTVPTDENRMIARHAYRLVAPS